MIKLRPSYERGHIANGWLDTYHTFSFNTYYDPAWTSYRTLRVINDDVVQPGQGFGMHPHRDMEVITYVLDGALEHKDSMGNGSVIRPGDVQKMSAGTGIVHSEFNPSDKEPVRLLQIWIFPDQKGLAPEYEQKRFERVDRLNRLRLIASPDGAEGSVTIHQDARIYATILESGRSVSLPADSGRHFWVHVARGEADLNGLKLSSGDGVAVDDEKQIWLTAAAESEILIFDLN